MSPAPEDGEAVPEVRGCEVREGAPEAWPEGEEGVARCGEAEAVPEFGESVGESGGAVVEVAEFGDGVKPRSGSGRSRKVMPSAQGTGRGWSILPTGGGADAPEGAAVAFASE
jgi:hypothetical protein